MHGGDRIAQVLVDEGVTTLFTLCGGHISPILTGAKGAGIRVIDTRSEATAMFAADAMARLTGIPGVAVVTAGPGVTNTLTALRNAKMAHTPVVLLGGATAGPLRGRGALQDIDQPELIRSHVKWSARASRVRELAPMLREAFARARGGLPGPVFLECAVDLLYDEALVRDWFEKKGGSVSRSLRDRAIAWYLRRHLDRVFAPGRPDSGKAVFDPMHPRRRDLEKMASRLHAAERPVMILGSQVTAVPERNESILASLETLQIPVWLSGMARGLLGIDHPLHLRHRRRDALRDADLVVLAGVPNDFRLDYGRQIPRTASTISISRSKEDLTLNRRPSVAIHADPGELLARLSEIEPSTAIDRSAWISVLRERDDERDQQIAEMAQEETSDVNPIALLREIDSALDERSVLVGDGGDFVATASYVVRPRGPLSWLDPGPFGTLGVGAGFAMAAAVARPDSEVWLLWGDGSAGFGLMEIDTLARHRIPVIAVIGNDACWTQIAREQIEVLDDDVGCVLDSSDYHLVAEALGGRGLDLRSRDEIPEVIETARKIARGGLPVVINARIGTTAFRKGAISM